MEFPTCFPPSITPDAIALTPPVSALNPFGTSPIAPPANVVTFLAYAPPIPGMSNGAAANARPV